MFILTCFAKVVSFYFTLLIMEENSSKPDSNLSAAEKNQNANDESLPDGRAVKKVKTPVVTDLEGSPGDHKIYRQIEERLIIDKSDNTRLDEKRGSLDGNYRIMRPSSLHQLDLNGSVSTRRPRSLQPGYTDRIAARQFSSLQSAYTEDGSDDGEEVSDPTYGPFATRRSPYEGLNAPLSQELPGLVSPFHMKPPGAPVGGRAFMSDIKKMAPSLSLEGESIRSAINFKR